MRLIVIKKFRDKITKKVYSPGDEINHFDDARAKNAIAEKWCKGIDEPKDSEIDLTKSAGDVIAAVKATTDLEKLRGFLVLENAGKPRKTVVEAMETRINELAG